MRLGLDGVDRLIALTEETHVGIAEAMQPFWLRGWLPPAAFARPVYRAARLANGAVARGLGGSLALLPAPAPAAGEPGSRDAPGREIWLAALNGVIGDHLEASDNPLALAMAPRYKGRLLLPEDPHLAARLGGATDHLLLLVHGLCMADVFWHRDGHHHGRYLAGAAGVTPVGIAYNTGRHIAANGRDLAALTGRLAAHWPGPLRRISLIGYSMGGLVVRAALDQARRERMPWLAQAAHAVYLGAPHHGAPLERGGHQLQALADLNPFLAPLGRLARVRSAGITDLRHGSIAEEDRAASPDRFGREAGIVRKPVPLDPAFRHHAVAATLGVTPGDAADRLLGDGLVPVDSAFGRHPDPAYDLGIGARDRLLVTRSGHLDLLASRPVAQQLAKWIAS
ncbi:PGAP1-like protein [Zavarzinia compransoris]|nr:PGAP1-like protein [Zavarzinia compransoris]